jgi:hypothetical protein
LIFILLAGSTTPVFAQDYRFQVPEQAAVVTINKDGSINIDYTIKFYNDSGAHAIDAVDIGLPNYDYQLKNISADVNGVAINKITDSPYVSPGIAVELQNNEIPAGGSGIVHVYIQNVKNVIYPGTQEESEEYASLVFSPSWFGSEYCYGNTNYQVTLVLPAGVADGEGRYFIPENWPGGNEPESWTLETGQTFYTWVSDQANSYTQYTFGTSFPSRYLDAGAIVQTPYVAPTESRPSFDLSNLCPVIFCLGFVGFFVLIIYSATVGAKKRKLQYLPPKISIEGHGIKRGLTAVEVAVLKEQPMDKIFTMTLFGLLKKGAAEVVTKDLLDLKASEPLPEGLNGYETDFLTAFTEKNTAARRKLLQAMMVALIRTVGEKMKGFSKKETLVYYETIMQKAWEQVEQAGTPEVKAQVYEEVMDWTMLDKKYEDRTRDTFSGPVLIPTPSWWWRYDPTVLRPSTSTTSTVSTPHTTPPSLPGGKSISLPSMPGSAFAASVVNSVSSFSSSVLGGLTGFTSGVTNITNPPPPPSTYRSSGHSSGGGGHSCACACACAGCACACAGGGR